MKKLLLAILALGSTAHLVADMRYDPLNNLMYSHPETSDINKLEYMQLLYNCFQIGTHMTTMNNGITPFNKDILDQLFFYLKNVGTPTAIRLISDLKKNTIHFENGAFMRKIYA